MAKAYIEEDLLLLQEDKVYDFIKEFSAQIESEPTGYKLRFTLQAPRESPYWGFYLPVWLHYPLKYPNQPVQIVFDPPLIHPNVNPRDGELVINQSYWRAEYRTKVLLSFIVYSLCRPVGTKIHYFNLPFKLAAGLELEQLFGLVRRVSAAELNRFIQEQLIGTHLNKGKQEEDVHRHLKIDNYIYLCKLDRPRRRRSIEIIDDYQPSIKSDQPIKLINDYEPSINFIKSDQPIKLINGPDQSDLEQKIEELAQLINQMDPVVVQEKVGKLNELLKLLNLQQVQSKVEQIRQGADRITDLTKAIIQPIQNVKHLTQWIENFDLEKSLNQRFKLVEPLNLSTTKLSNLITTIVIDLVSREIKRLANQIAKMAETMTFNHLVNVADQIVNLIKITTLDYVLDYAQPVLNLINQIKPGQIVENAEQIHNLAIFINQNERQERVSCINNLALVIIINTSLDQEHWPETKHCSCSNNTAWLKIK